MRALVVYESMFGNTRAVAEAVAEGLSAGGEARTRAIGTVDEADLEGIDLLVLGAPTHAWSLSRARTRAGAAQQAAESHGALTLEPAATGPGLRDWLDEGVVSVDQHTEVVCFDTRMSAPFGLSGSAARAATHRLRRVGCDIAEPPVSFLVTKENHLADGELDRARAWGRRLAARVLAGR